MDRSGIITNLWKDIGAQNWTKISSYFTRDAIINWHNTNESFDVYDFVRANREYPGNWNIKIERIEETENTIISVVKVIREGGGSSFHATSFFNFNGEKIIKLDEYWGDDGEAPEWRREEGIGRRSIE